MLSDLAATSIPLHRSVVEAGILSKSEYLSILADRVAWLICLEDNPEEAQRELVIALEDLGAWSGPGRFGSPAEAVQALIVDNAAFPHLFRCAVNLPRSPWVVCQMPAAVRAVQETSLPEWIASALRTKLPRGETTNLSLDQANSLMMRASARATSQPGLQASQRADLRRAAWNLRAAMRLYRPSLEGGVKPFPDGPIMFPKGQGIPSASQAPVAEPDQQRPWPLAGTPVAWGVRSNLAASSIPLHKDVLRDGSLSSSEYLSILTDRVAWLISLEDDPKAAQRELADELERLGAWNGRSQFDSPWDAANQMLQDNPAFPDLFNLVVALPRSPWRVRRVPAAVRAVKQTNLSEWIAAALPILRD